MATTEQPTTLVTAGRIITTAAGDPYLIANVPSLAIVGDRIVAAGDLASLRQRMPGAELVDFGQQATIMPGFNDAHQHPTMTAANQRGVDLSTADSPDELMSALRDRARRTPRGEWIIGTRYDHGRATGGKPLTRAELDAVSEAHPLLVINIGAHWGVLNSAGLAQ